MGNVLQMLQRYYPFMMTTTTNHNPAPWTDRQGQYLAFIYAYTTIHRQAPAEADMQRFFRTTPPTVHNMVKALEQHGYIRRQPGMPRSIQLLVACEQLPILRPVA